MKILSPERVRYRNVEIYYSNLIDSYVCLNAEVFKKFLSDFKKFTLYEMFIKGYRISLQMWSTSINKEAEDLILNLDSQNEVFWQNMRMKVEEWQLHFLSQNTHRLASVSNLQRLKYFRTLNQKTENRWFDDLKQVERYL